MQIELFYKKIKTLIFEGRLNDVILENGCKLLLSFLDEIISDNQIDEINKLTRMTILFEGLYRFIPETSGVKKDMNQIRLNRWHSHYGTPTIAFLISFHDEIDKTKNIFKNLSTSQSKLDKPWNINNSTKLLTDTINRVLVSEVSSLPVEMPVKEEKAGEFIKTLNPIGGFTTTPCDIVSQKFIDFASNIAKKEGKVLEIGAAFGAASIPALVKGVTVFSNDIESKNLAVIRNRYLRIFKNQPNSVTGDSDKLILLPGSFPEELMHLPKNFFDAILICRVLHFFKGDQIENSLKLFSEYLKPGGKIFIVCETPYLKNWKKFIPEYENRVSKGIDWPGEITNPAEFESSGRAESLPTFVHWITKEILEKSLKKAKFAVEHVTYIDRSGQFPPDLLLDGRESVGAIAAKL